MVPTTSRQPMPRWYVAIAQEGRASQPMTVNVSEKAEDIPPCLASPEKLDGTYLAPNCLQSEHQSVAKPSSSSLPEPPMSDHASVQAEAWRRKLPRRAAVVHQTSFADAVRQCDQIVYGQTSVKRRVALSFQNADAIGHRFYYYLSGPAGVGKTSLAKSLGNIFGRPVQVIRCDRLSSPEDLYGYGPNWKSPAPGLIAQALVSSACTNPILFFDEIDKVSGDKRNAILSALNEFLSRETIQYFDNFLQMSIDISSFSFLCAGNSTDVFQRIPWLQSRMGQILPFSGFDREGLLSIVGDYLLPAINDRRFQQNPPLWDGQPFALTAEAKEFLIDRYLQHMGPSCGVRQLSDWINEIFSGYRQLGVDGKSVSKTWLKEHWLTLFPGISLASESSQNLDPSY